MYEECVSPTNDIQYGGPKKSTGLWSSVRPYLGSSSSDEDDVNGLIGSDRLADPMKLFTSPKTFWPLP